MSIISGKIVFPYQLTMFAGIQKHFDNNISINDENKNRVETTVSNQHMWVRNHVSIFLSIVNKDLQVIIKYCMYNKYSLSLKGYRF